MSSPRYWPGFAQSERRRRRCGRDGGGGVVDDGGGNGGSGRIIAAFQGRERELVLCSQNIVLMMEKCGTLWSVVARTYCDVHVLMHLVVLGAF